MGPGVAKPVAERADTIASQEVLERCERKSMIPLTNIHPLTDFKRRTTEFRKRLKKTGQPEVLTVEGRPELVVQDAASYQRMLEAADRAGAIEGIRAGLADVEAGRTVPASRVFREMRDKIKLRAKRP